MDHTMTDVTDPCKIDHTVYPIKIQSVFNMVTVLRNIGCQFLSAAFAFPSVSVERILPIHIVLEVIFPFTSLREAGNIHVLRCVN